MRALTIRQPWASAIVHGPKRVENRKRRPPQKAIGQRFAIHAGAAVPSLQLLLQVQELWPELPWPFLPSQLDLGSVIGVATLEGVVPASEAFFIPQHRGWVTGPWCWMLEGVESIPEPVPCRGQLGLWTLPDDVETRVLGQLR
jgi:hypothetical protein